MITSKLLKVAWIRNNAPAGYPAPGHLRCPCGNSPESWFKPGPDIICNCGRRYSWEGCIKGRSIGSDTLTAYKVIFEDGSFYCTSMAEDVNLQVAYRYFIDRNIDGKYVADVEPCQI